MALAAFEKAKEELEDWAYRASEHPTESEPVYRADVVLDLIDEAITVHQLSQLWAFMGDGKPAHLEAVTGRRFVA